MILESSGYAARPRPDSAIGQTRQEVAAGSAAVTSIFDEVDLNQQQRLKCAFDPDGLLNPGKVFPQLHRCAELGRMHIHRGQVAFPDLPRF